MRRLISDSRNNKLAAPEYELRSYEELSKEFKEKASRAFELVPLMYNRLTLIDQLSHKQAIKKIFNDHAHIRGFSFRNISRYLPLDNSVIPRRVRPPPRKSIPTHNTVTEKLSNADLQGETNKHEFQDREDPIQFTDYNELRTQNAELKEVISRQKAMVRADKIHSIEVAFRIPKEKYEDVKTAMNSSSNYCYLLFDAYTGMLLRSASD